MITPTAVTILYWLYLSDASRQPILEKKSEPDQHSKAIMESQNQLMFLPQFQIYNVTNPASAIFCRLMRMPILAWFQVRPPWKYTA